MFIVTMTLFCTEGNRSLEEQRNIRGDPRIGRCPSQAGETPESRLLPFTPESLNRDCPRAHIPHESPTACLTELPQSWWLNTIGTELLSVLEAGSPKVTCQHLGFLWSSAKESSLPASSGHPQSSVFLVSVPPIFAGSSPGRLSVS